MIQATFTLGPGVSEVTHYWSTRRCIAKRNALHRFQHVSGFKFQNVGALNKAMRRATFSSPPPKNRKWTHCQWIGEGIHG